MKAGKYFPAFFHAMSQKDLKLKLTLEAFWWIATAIIILVVLLPIFQTFKIHPFLKSNILFILVFITFTRYIFLLKNTFLARIRPIKILLIVACLPLTFYLISLVYDLQMFLDENGKQALMIPEYMKDGLTAKKQENVINYMRSEMLFFGVGSIITSMLMPLRMILSIWRTYNTEDKV